ncbi:MAG: thioredoxin-dependent thiol peroxidase [Candidatus Diapherotrites archaeon]|uniref:thioredoxin-dependent peroxiredoxin n=1 Tax=Candidatus Iainarchaeum sp. TaxID=3101447 RepID=A0A2D6LPE7_9ARCH|nr:thioredoxin-dependent thiol peroxidase [Candidatus Diapherotrites archaeon]|tara:strand:- start:7561 stop:8019 length:459 start_codon:yes stop_codon:yes gene_type:complete
MLETGQKAPGFSLKSQGEKTIKLSDFKGKKVALYFYPKDDTPGCTKQGCNIRDNFSELRKKGIIVLGISKDSIQKHQKFSGKYGFNFPILSDENGKVIEKYGVFKEKSMFGKTFMGIKRTTFLIDENGKIKKIIKKPDVINHSEEIISGFEE